jgi:hypothetical protein
MIELGSAGRDRESMKKEAPVSAVAGGCMRERRDPGYGRQYLKPGFTF